MVAIGETTEEWVERVYRRTIKPPIDEPIYEWARREVELDPSSPIPGPYRIELTPMMREPLDCYKDESVRHIVTIGPNQGGRTKAQEIACLWSVVHRPGPTQWNTDTNEKAGDIAEQRWWPMAERVKSVAALFPTNHDRKRKREIIWSNGLPLVIQGANVTNFQQQSVMNQFNDEIFKWGTGLLSDAHIRCDVSYAWSHKIWDGSVPGNEGEDLCQQWKESSMGEWSFKCRKCGTYQRFEWGGLDQEHGIKWETSELTKPGGEYNWDELVKTVHYVCVNKECRESYKDSTISRREMNESAKYIHTHPHRKVRGFRFNILSVNWPGLTWGKFVVEFLLARRSAKEYYNTEKLRLFVTRRLAEFWEEDKYLALAARQRVADYSLSEGGVPNVWMQNKWEGEYLRFLSVDKQEYDYRTIARAVKTDGASRLIQYGRVHSYTEIAELAKQLDIKPKRVLIDSGFEASEVYSAAIKYGWTCFKGEDKEEGYLHRISDPVKKRDIVVRRPYSPRILGDPNMGTKMQARNRGMILRNMAVAPLYKWSNLLVKNTLAALRDGRANVYFGVPSDVDSRYHEEMAAEVRYKIINRKGRVSYYWSNAGKDGKGHKKPNHAFDLECQIVVAMMMMGYLDADVALPEENIDTEGAIS